MSHREGSRLLPTDLNGLSFATKSSIPFVSLYLLGVAFAYLFTRYQRDKSCGAQCDMSNLIFIALVHLTYFSLYKQWYITHDVTGGGL